MWITNLKVDLRINRPHFVTFKTYPLNLYNTIQHIQMFVYVKMRYQVYKMHEHASKHYTAFKKLKKYKEITTWSYIVVLGWSSDERRPRSLRQRGGEGGKVDYGRER